MKRVKGFTLIELIVVLAIFSIIMFAATSLMTPASKIMTNAENMENGSAAVSSISKYLETELSTAEYLRVYGYKVGEGTGPNNMDEKVADFAGTYYGGVLRAGTDPNATDPAYGDGVIHVLQFDNSNGGMITKWDYTADFKPTGFSTPANPGETAKVNKVSVTQVGKSNPVNKAYYDSYDFTIIPGTIQNIANFDEVYQSMKLGSKIWNDTNGNGLVEDDEKTNTTLSILTNISPANTVFSIRATRKEKCKVCGADYHMNADTGKMVCDCSPSTTPRQFVNVAAMSLVNIYQRQHAAVSGHYFVIQHIPASGLEPEKNVIVDRAKKGTDGYIDIEAGYKYEAADGTDEERAKAAADSFTFIYSYGSEQDTSAP